MSENSCISNAHTWQAHVCKVLKKMPVRHTAKHKTPLLTIEHWCRIVEDPKNTQNIKGRKMNRKFGTIPVLDTIIIKSNYHKFDKTLSVHEYESVLKCESNVNCFGI